MRYIEIIKELEKKIDSLPQESDPLYSKNIIRLDISGSADSLKELSKMAGKIGNFDLISNGKEAENKNKRINVYDTEDNIDYKFLTEDRNIYIAKAKVNTGKIMLISSGKMEELRLRLMLNGYNQILILAEEGSKIAVEEFFEGEEAGIINEINAKEGSNIKIDIINEARKSLSFYTGAAGDNSRIEVNSFFVGEAKSNNKIICNQNSSAHINNIIVAQSKNVDITDYIVNSSQNAKGFISARTIGKNATIFIKENSIIEKGANGSEANIIAKGINMGGSKIEAIPAMTTNENDVKAMHSADMAPLSNAFVEYLMSRGISPKDSRKLLLKGFLYENMNAFQSKDLLESIIDNHLGKILGD
jgi:hypothetical protein